MPRLRTRLAIITDVDIEYKGFFPTPVYGSLWESLLDKSRGARTPPLNPPLLSTGRPTGSVSKPIFLLSPEAARLHRSSSPRPSPWSRSSLRWRPSSQRRTGVGAPRVRFRGCLMRTWWPQMGLPGRPIAFSWKAVSSAKARGGESGGAGRQPSQVAAARGRLCLSRAAVCVSPPWLTYNSSHSRLATG